MKLLGKFMGAMLCMILLVGSVPDVITKASQSNTREILEREITIYEDGSYCVCEIIVENRINRQMLKASTKTRKATKSNKYYNSFGKLQFIVAVTADFQYDGITASALSSNYGHKVSNTAWRFLEGASYCAGDSATAECTFASSTETRTWWVTITCSADGVIS